MSLSVAPSNPTRSLLTGPVILIPMLRGRRLSVIRQGRLSFNQRSFAQRNRVVLIVRRVRPSVFRKRSNVIDHDDRQWHFASRPHLHGPGHRLASCGTPRPAGIRNPHQDRHQHCVRRSVLWRLQKTKAGSRRFFTQPDGGRSDESRVFQFDHHPAARLSLRSP